MNKKQLEAEKAKLAAEAKELQHLKAIYKKAAEDVSNKIAIHDGTINVLLKDYDNLDDVQKSILQSKIYQKQFQESLQKQLNGFLADLNSGQYKSIDEYLDGCYETGFLGSMYDIHGQGIPIITPIDQKKVVKAKDIDSKINKKLYERLGDDVDLLKKRIANNISRGIATSDSFVNIARNIASASNMGFNRAMRIARTEGHRIQATAAFDAQNAAKDAGADIVKQWDAALDGRTRDSHRMLDGQIMELDELFEVNGHTARFPSDFGRPEEDINCRCALLQRARWDLDGGFEKMNNFTKKIESFESPESYAEFKKGFFSDENVKYMNYVQKLETKYGTKDFRKILDSMTEREYNHYSKLLENNPVFNKKAVENTAKSSTIKSIDIDDLKAATYGKNIASEVEDTIYKTIKTAERNGELFVSNVVVKNIAPTRTGIPVLQIEPDQFGLLQLNMNAAVLADKTLDEIDAMFVGHNKTKANTLEEAVKHECGHAKLIKGMNIEQIEALYAELADIHIEGISEMAYSDGAECIAEVEILLFRGEPVPEEALKLYEKYIKR